MVFFTQEHDLRTSIKVYIKKVLECLEVFTLLDIATGDGTEIRLFFSLGLKIDTKSNWDWYEERPLVLYLSRWKGAMLLLLDETTKLHVTLGKWIALHHHDWIWFYSMKD